MSEEETSRQLHRRVNWGPLRVSLSTITIVTGRTTPTDAKVEVTSKPATEGAAQTHTPTSVTNPLPASTEVTNTHNEVPSMQPYIVRGTTTIIVVANAPATGGETSVNSQVTSTSNVNNAVAKPNPAGTSIEVPSHLRLSLVVAILSQWWVGRCCKSRRSLSRSGDQTTRLVRRMYCGIVVQSMRLHRLFIDALLR